jgi:acyl carrier protein
VSRAEILEKLKNVILASNDLNYRAKNKSIDVTSRFREDLGLDSILLIALLCELQPDFAFLNEDDLANWLTIEDCINSIAKGLSA